MELEFTPEQIAGAKPLIWMRVSGECCAVFGEHSCKGDVDSEKVSKESVSRCLIKFYGHNPEVLESLPQYGKIIEECIQGANKIYGNQSPDIDLDFCGSLLVIKTTISIIKWEMILGDEIDDALAQKAIAYAKPFTIDPIVGAFFSDISGSLKGVNEALKIAKEEAARFGFKEQKARRVKMWNDANELSKPDSKGGCFSVVLLFSVLIFYTLYQ